MKRAAMILAAFAAACGSSEKSEIGLFEASPATVQAGGTTTLLFSATNATSLKIDQGIGDVTGKSQIDVSPAQTTSYTITAVSKDGVTSTKKTTVTVVPSRASSYLVETPSSATAGADVTVTITALGADGQVVDSFVGTATLSTDDTAAALPHLATFAAGGHGKTTATAVFHAAGPHIVVASDAQARGTASLAVKNGATSSLAIAGLPSEGRAGDAVTLRITATDAFGNVAQDFNGTVGLTSSDAQALLAPNAPGPSNVTFGPGDSGVKIVSISFAKAGSSTVTVASGSFQASASIVVSNAKADGFNLRDVPAEATAGDALSLTVIAHDRFGNVAVDYTGTVHVASADDSADVTFAAADAGSKTVSLAVGAAGVQTLTANDSGGLSGSSPVNVKPAAAVAYRLSALPGSATAGQPLALTVTALDSKGNVVTNYAGVSHFSSPEATDQLPADGGFTNGVRTVSLALLKAGTRAVTVSEVSGTLTATTGAVAVSAAAASKFTLTGPASVVAGTAGSYTVAAFDAYGNAATAYAGTVHVTSSDAQAVTPADGAASGGTKSISVTLKTAGSQTITASDGPISATTTVLVSGSDAASISLSDVPAGVNAGEPAPVTVTARDAYGNVATSFTGSVTFTTGDTKATLPAPSTFTAGDQGRRTFSFKLGTVGSWSLNVNAGGFSTSSGSIAVSAGAAHHIRFSGLPSSTHAGDSLTATLTVKDRYDNTATSYASTIHLILTNAGSTVGDATPSAGVATVSFHFATVGKQSLVVSDPVLTGSVELDVTPSQAVSYQLAALPSIAVAGQPLTLVATALDSFGNVDTAYGAVGHVAGSTGDQLPADTAFSAGRLSVGIAFTRTGSHSVTLSQSGGTITQTSSLVTVNSDFADSLVVTPGAGGSATAGVAASLTVTVVDKFANQVPTYTGVVDFTSTDPQFVSPGATAFTGTDAGSRAFSATFKTAGTAHLDTHDVGTPAINGGAVWTVVPGAAASCAIDQNPAAITGGASFAFRVTIADGFGNKATNYAGTIGLSATDAAVQFAQSSVTYVPATDLGAHVFTAKLMTVGVQQQITATDVANAAVTCSFSAAAYAPSVHYTVTFGQDANYGAPAMATITVLDAANAVIPGYAGTVTFSSSDAAAILPANVVFTGAEGGTATAAVTFKNLGTQSFTASEQGNPLVTGTGSVPVHGLVYTNPAVGTSLRLVQNATSNPGVVQLDLVIDKTVRNGFGAGMNLPADATRVLADTTPLIEGTVFSAGATPTVNGAVQANNLLYTVVGRKNTAGGVGNDLQLTAGGVIYSVRLKLKGTALVGVVFDGSGPMPGFRAAVRDRLGNDTVAQTDFGVGKLEVR